LSLMSWRVPILEAEGKIMLNLPEGADIAANIAGEGGEEADSPPQSQRTTEDRSSKPLYILYDRAKFRAVIESIPLEDGQLRASWGNQIFRILLTAKKIPLTGDFVIRLAQR